MKIENVDFCASLYNVTLLYEKVIGILDTFSTTLFTIKDPSLNQAFLALISEIDNIEKTPEFKQLNIQTPPLFESLVGDIENMDIDWEYNKKYVEEYLAKLNAFLSTQCKQYVFKPNDATKKLLSQADDSIQEFERKYLSQKPLELSTINEEVTAKSNQEDKIYHWNKLELNVTQGTIQYDSKPIKEISSNANGIKFLIFLFDNPRVVEYLEIAKYLELNSYHTGCTSQNVAREIQYIKRDLLKFLKTKVGMPEKEAKSMFFTKRKSGFKLHQ